MSSSAAPHDPPADPRADFRASLGWIALGAAMLVGGWTMGRLENQDVNPYTVPGLLPGLLGIVMMLLGSALGIRSWRQGGARRAGTAARPAAATWRIGLTLALCIAFDVGLVGHGLPFWAAAALFVSIAILTLQHGQRKAAGLRLTPGTILTAIAIGLGAGAAITLVFQEIFLVRLP